MSPMSTTEQSHEHNRDPQLTTVKHLEKIPENPSRQSGDDEAAAEGSTTRSQDSPEMLGPSSLGLNHIRTKSSPAPSPLGFSSATPSVQEKARVGAADARADARARWPIPPHQPDQGIYCSTKHLILKFRDAMMICCL